MIADRNENTYRPFGLYRFFLAVLVIFQHVPLVGPDGNQIYRLATGTTAVNAFFSLSGFIVVEAVDRFYAGRPVAFTTNRLLRIVPQYIIALLIAIACYLYGFQNNLLPNEMTSGFDRSAFNIDNILRNVFGFLPLGKLDWAFIPYAWAIRVEILFYLALIFVAYSAVPNHVAFLVLFVLSAILLLIFLNTGYKHLYMSSFMYAPYFWFGGACYFATKHVKYRMALTGLIVLCFLTCLAIFDQYIIPSQMRDVSFSAAERAWHLFSCAVLLLAQPVLASVRLSDRRRYIDRAFGNLSYPIYLQQYTVIVLGSIYLSHSWTSIFICLFIILVVSMLSEHAADRWLTGLRSRVRGRAL